MIQKLSLPITVLSLSDHRLKTATPKKVLFAGRQYIIKKLGYHHVFRLGRTLYHVFSVASETTFFRLLLNTETLLWTLEEIADAETN